MGLDWFSVATEASGGGTPDLLSVLEVLGYMELYRQKKHVRGATGPHKAGARPRGAPPPSWTAPISLDVGSKSIRCVSFQN